MLVSCAGNTDCKFQPGVNVEAQDIEKIKKRWYKRLCAGYSQG